METEEGGETQVNSTEKVFNKNQENSHNPMKEVPIKGQDPYRTPKSQNQKINPPRHIKTKTLNIQDIKLCK